MPQSETSAGTLTLASYLPDLPSVSKPVPVKTPDVDRPDSEKPLMNSLDLFNSQDTQGQSDYQPMKPYAIGNLFESGDNKLEEIPAPSGPDYFR